MARTYGYARVSTREQNLDRQLDALAGFGVGREDIFADRASGRDFERPEWLRMKGTLRAGDVLVVKSIDRFGRSYEEIIEQWREITKEIRADVVVLDMPLLDTREDKGGVTGALISDIVLQLLSYVAQVEREEHPPAAGRGHRRGAGARGALRAAGEEEAGDLRGDAGRLPGGAHHALRGGVEAQGLHIHVRQMGAPGPRGRLTRGRAGCAFTLVNGSFPVRQKVHLFMSLKT